MKHIILFVALALSSVPRLCRAATPPGDDPKVVEITASDTLKFSVTRIEARPGQKVRVQLHNLGSMPKEVMGHNWILLQAGSDVAAYASSALAARSTGYQPKALDNEVVASIPLLGPRQTADVTFAAPAQPGTYPFLCTFPGHFQAGMRGVLIVE